MRTGYAVVLNLEQKQCTVVGGGPVAERKVLDLLEAGAEVCVIAPQVSEELGRLARAGRVRHVGRPYRTGDLSGAFLVISATDSPEVNEQVYAEAQAVGALVNVVDRPELCSFFVPATVRRGPLLLGVATTGSSPALAGYIRRRLEQDWGEEYGQLAALLGKLRAEARVLVAERERRRAMWEEMLRCRALELLRSGDRGAAEAELRQILDRYAGDSPRDTT